MDRHVMRALNYRDEFSAPLTAGAFVFSDAENTCVRELMDDTFRKIGYAPKDFSRRTATRDCDNSMLSLWDDVKTDIHATFGDSGLISLTFDYGTRAGSQLPMLGLTGHAINTSFPTMKSWVLGALDAPGSHTVLRTRGYATDIHLEPLRTTFRALSCAQPGCPLEHDGIRRACRCFGHAADKAVKKVKADKNVNEVLFGARRSFAQMTGGVRLIVTVIRYSRVRREYFRCEVDRAIDLAPAIYQLDKNMKGKTTAETNEWTANVSYFKKDVPDLKMVAPVLAATEDLLTLLGTTGKPRIGFVIFAIN
jgi:hypothetical protein